jgi:hypothetical protein
MQKARRIIDQAGFLRFVFDFVDFRYHVEFISILRKTGGLH